MSPENSRYRILLPTDFTKNSESAFFHALKITLCQQGKIHILHVDPPDGMAVWDQFPRVRRTLARWGLIEEGADRSAVESLKIMVKKSIAVNNDPEVAITKKIEKHHIDLMVMPTHRRTGVQRILKRSIACTVAGKTRKNTLFFPEDCRGFVDHKTGQVDLNHILIPVCDAPRPRTAVDAALDLVRTLEVKNARITLLHVAKSLDAPPPCPLPDEPDVSFELETATGSVEETILNIAEEKNCRCIVMATRGRTSLTDLLLGSTTERIVQGAPCPVLAIHQ